MNRQSALSYVAFVADDAGALEYRGVGMHALVREHEQNYHYRSVLVGWNMGSKPTFVAVHSYLDVELTDEEAKEIATECLAERDWFPAGRPVQPAYIIR